jgi:predicted trehalose synthase
MPLDEAFGRAAARHLRGGEDPEPTLVLTRGLAKLLARLHIALATPSEQLAQPITFTTASDAAELASAARDAVAEAVVLTDADTQQHVRARRHAMREAFGALAQAVGSPRLPAAPFISLHQAYQPDDDEQSFLLDPLQLVRAASPRIPVADVAFLLRSLNHVAHGALRRLVGGGESVPVERVASWAQAVRAVMLEDYLQALEQAGHAELFDARLLLGLELEAECRSLSYAARHLSTWSTVPDAGLMELLPPD